MELFVVRNAKPLSVLLLVLASLLSGTASAATASSSTAGQIQAIRDNAVRAATQMMMYVALEKAKERRQLAQTAIGNIDTAVAGLNDPALATHWQTTRTALTRDPYQDGEINQLAIYGWENEVVSFTNDLDQRMPRDIERSKKELFELASRMQLMMMIYLRNSADPLGGTNYTGVNSDKELDKLAAAFTAHLNDVIRKNPTLKAPLAKVTAKWTFLSQRIGDLQQRNVPFIADLYGRQIIDMLLATANKS